MFRRLALGLVVLGFAVGYSSFFEHTATADIGSCSAQVYLHSTAQGSDPDFQFQISNNDSNAIKWIGISRPSENFVLLSSNAAGWNSSSDTQHATFTNNTINPGDIFDQISVNAIATTAAASNSWTIQVSDDPSGANPFTCTGDLGTAIVPPAPVISNISVTELAPKSVIVNWSTDVDSTSLVKYGPNSDYGQLTTIDSNPVSNHSVKLTNLKPNSSYHFQVISITSDGGATAISNDNTFLTAVQESLIVPKTNAPIAVQITNPTDKTPPTISLNTNLPYVVQSMPVINGTATDDVSVSRVEYSTDNGHNWLPVDSASNLGGKTVGFSFTPGNLDDGNYSIIARAIDAGGNIATTTPIKVVLDRLPPLVGGSVVSIGPQVIANADGVIISETGVDEKITLSAVGGPTTINIVAQGQDKSDVSQTFSLSQSQDSELWSGIISFKKAGTYTLTANSIDGAGNKTTMPISKVMVLPAGQLMDGITKKPISGQLTVHSMQPDSNNWVVWDGSPYGQANPQPVGQDGQFSYLLPSGKYYLSVIAAKHRSITSDIFELAHPSPLSTNISLNSGSDSKLTSWLYWSSRALHLNTQVNSRNDKSNRHIGSVVPSFSLNDLNGQTIHDTDLLGKPTDLVFMSTWAPTTSEQLPALSSLDKNKNINIKPVAIQENSAKLTAYNEITGYNLNWLADPLSSTSQSFDTPSLPTHYFIDRNGTIKHVISALLNQQQILNELSDL